VRRWPTARATGFPSSSGQPPRHKGKNEKEKRKNINLRVTSPLGSCDGLLLLLNFFQNQCSVFREFRVEFFF
jgi:hypothetical protein